MMQLSKIKISNFRSIEMEEIENLKKINIFMGKNNSGKSSVLHAIYFAQKNQDPFNTQFQDCVFLNDVNRVIEIILHDNEVSHKIIWSRSILETSDRGEFPNDNIYYLMADRGIYHRYESIIGGKPSDVGLHGEYTNRAMVYIKQNEEDKFAKIRTFAEDIGIDTKNIDNLLISEGNSQVTFVDNQNNLKFNIILGGFGQSQLLPLIVQAFDAPQESLLLFEEPEVSLHPGAQRNLLEKFANFVNEENKQIFLTSHSSYFLDTLKRWNDDGNNLLDNIALFNVSRSNGKTSVTSVPLGEIERTFRDFYER